MKLFSTHAGVRGGQVRRARDFWHEFTSGSARQKIIYGNNIYTECILRFCRVDAVVDDFASSNACGTVPIIKTSAIPKDALVLVASGGRPLTVRKKLREMGVEHLDYFALIKSVDASLTDVVFNEGFSHEYAANQDQFRFVYDRLADESSREVFSKLLAFRDTYDIEYLEGFTDRQREQYFEDFLRLDAAEETFVDVGAFDGFTSLEFMRRYPEYRAVEVFEPDPVNFRHCSSALAGRPRVRLHQLGASDKAAMLSFAANGSTSALSSVGSICVRVEKLDELPMGRPTFIKMDIEGAELDALRGAQNLIANNRPRLAICAYHRPSDLWRIPRFVLDCCSNYDLYMRHYTECIYETVIFFVPQSVS